MKPTNFFIALIAVALIGNNSVKAQRSSINWTKDGNSYYQNTGGEIVTVTLPTNERKIVISSTLLTPANMATPLAVRSFQLTDDGKKALIYTNTKRVWRQDSRGDYWIADIANQTLKQIGKGKPTSSLMFAKFSPDGSKVAYVSEHNIYVEDLVTNTIKALTTNGTARIHASGGVGRAHGGGCHPNRPTGESTTSIRFQIALENLRVVPREQHLRRTRRHDHRAVDGGVKCFEVVQRHFGQFGCQR